MKLKRAYSPGEVLNMKIPRFEFSGDWQTSIGNPAKSGVWIIWGASGNGKSSFVMQLAKYLCSFGRVIYDSLEESTGLSFQMSLKRHKMGEVKKKLIILPYVPSRCLLSPCTTIRLSVTGKASVMPCVQIRSINGGTAWKSRRKSLRPVIGYIPSTSCCLLPSMERPIPNTTLISKGNVIPAKPASGA